MVEGTVIAVCQFGGDFVSNDDGTISYSGGEAHAIDISRDMKFDDLKSELTSMFNIDSSPLSIKYFLPGNQRTLITISSDKDLRRMVDFNMGSITTDLYISSKVDSRAHRNIGADSGTSIVDKVGAVCSVRSERLTAVNGSSKRIVAADSVTLSASSPTVDIVEQQRFVTDDNIEDRATHRSLADSSTPIIIAVDAAENAGPQSAPWDCVITEVGQEFDNVKAFRDELCKYAFVKGFAYKYIKNDNVRVTVKCTVETCPWRIHASGSARKQKFIIKKFNNVHTCGAGSGDDGHQRATRHWLARIVKEKLLDNPQSKPRDIARDIYRDYGINLNYTQAWHAKEAAQKELHFLHEEVCNQLPRLCKKIMEANPGSITTLAASVDSKVRRVFVSLHASLHGFEHGCRPLLFLDRIPLKANNQWKLLGAAAMDGDDGIFPVAFAAVEAETHNSWHWFLVQLKHAVSTSRNITIVSCRQKGLDESVPRVFEDSFHAYSLFHLIEELKAELKKSSYSEQDKRAIVNNFKSAAQTYVVDDFNTCIDRIKNISTDVAEWVMSTKPEHWSYSLFRGSRYDHLSANIVESLSRWIAVKDESTIVQLIGALHAKIKDVLDSRRQTSSTWAGTLTPSIEQKLQKEIPKARMLLVVCSSDSVFEVHGSSINVVNIASWECTCQRWQLMGLPCLHAIAVFNRVGRSAYDYCSRYFRCESYRLTYSASINPVPDIESISSVAGANSYPPHTQRPPGRRKRKRINPRKTSIRPLHCSRCKEAGHNKATCEAQL
ncbi:uncharacterized protein LOC103720843 isoform X2 [Phoenix dactylifera]|uniref:Uncharacterized protein LOC103720843 isoform X2 n=2 Tax=Phoenix dactylifera TaxID=42345 RepID=A0A8B7CXZ3_PHODC|nr:uncharacterized protein LOC103720843 isoform X2 [Phoenix dactylifera]